MDINKMKAGYQGKKDSMREFANKVADHPGHAPDTVYSKSCADKARMRLYKEGGYVAKDEEEDKDKKYFNTNSHIEKIKKTVSKEMEEENKAYKKGGAVRKCDKEGKPKFDNGGAVQKYRLQKMTFDGKQKGTGKESYTRNY
jgi:hypothetical protein